MLRRRAFIVLAVSAGLVVAINLPAQAASTMVQKKTVAGVNRRTGSVLRFADRTVGHIANSVTVSANDADGTGGRCTETWVDYSTKPHEHFNPGLLVNCSGGNRSVSGVLTNNSKNVAGVGISSPMEVTLASTGTYILLVENFGSSPLTYSFQVHREVTTTTAITPSRPRTWRRAPWRWSRCCARRA